MDASVLPLVAALMGEPTHPAPPPQPTDAVDKADWAELPSGALIASALEGTVAGQNLERGVSLRTVMRCELGAGGVAKTCVVLSESPQGCGMGELALKLAPKLRFTTTTRSGRPSEGTFINVPLVLPAIPGEAAEPLPGCKAAG